MKTKPLTPPANLVELNATYERLGADIESAVARVESLRANGATLDQRLAATNEQKPAEDCELDDPLVAALAADPGADLLSRDISVAAERSASIQGAMRAWRKEVSLIERAIAKVAEAIQQAQEEVVALRRARAEAYTAFVRAAHEYLIDLFRERFEALYTEVLGPLTAIENMRDHDGGEMINRFNSLYRDTVIKRSFFGPDGRTDEQFYPKMVRDGSRIVLAATVEDVERFRLSIAA